MAQLSVILILLFGIVNAQDQGHSHDVCPDIPGATCTRGPTAPPLPSTTPVTTAASATTTATTAATACALQLCASGSTCVPRGATFTCQCPAGRTGVTCHLYTGPKSTVKVTPAPTAPVCDRSMWDGCQQADVVFVLCNSQYEARDTVHTEGEMVKTLIRKYGVGDGRVRVAVVVYHDTVTEPIKLSDYPYDKSGLLHKVDMVTTTWGAHTGEPDIAKALVHVRDVTLKAARATARKIVIPVVHALRSDYQAAEDAAQNLKDECTQIWVQEVPRPIGWGLHSAKNIATSPDYPYYMHHYTTSDLLTSVRLLNINCHSVGR